MLNSPNGRVSWPRLNKPKLPEKGLFAQKNTPDAARNSWLEKEAVEPKPSPFKPITDGAHKVSQGTKKAWRKTVDAITPGEPEPAARTNGSSRIARQDVKPPFWKRMLGEKEETSGSRTMPEFMAQQRVDAEPNRPR
jgi:hypothetical protein